MLRPALLEQPLGLLEPFGRLARLRATVTAIGRRLPHRVGRFLQPSRRVRQILPLFTLSLGFAAQLFELPRRTLHFISQGALSGPAPRCSLLPSHPRRLLGLLQLPARKLAQPVGHFVHFLAGALLLRLLLHLVLIRHAIQFELEQISQFGCGATSTATTAAPTATALLHLELVQLFGLLQELQGSLFGAKRVLGFLRGQRSLSDRHFHR